MVRGDTRRPSLSSNSLAIRSSPHEGLSPAILRIRRWSSGGIRGRPDWHFRGQKNWKPLRCQPMKVLGVTTVSALRQLNQRLSHRRVKACWMGGPAGPDSPFLVERELFAHEEILGRERTFRSETDNQKA